MYTGPQRIAKTAGAVGAHATRLQNKASRRPRAPRPGSPARAIFAWWGGRPL